MTEPGRPRCAACKGTGRADWTSDDYVIPCGVCDGTGRMPEPAPEPAHRRRYRRASAFAIVATGACAVLNVFMSYTWGGMVNGLAGGFTLGVCVFLVWARRRTLNPPLPWAEVSVNGKTVAKFRVIEFPPGTTMELGVGMSQDLVTGTMALVSIEAITSISADEDDEHA